MQNIKVKDVMVPLEEYSTVSEDAYLFDAIVALEESVNKFYKTRHKHRAILVFDKNKNIVGKLGMIDVLRGIEPKFTKVEDLKNLPRGGLSPSFIKSMMKHYQLWEKPLDDICRKAAKTRVKDIMYTLTEGEYVAHDASLNEAINQLIVGHHQSLLVTERNKIIGILRLSDVFREICERIKACEIDSSN